jgi:hypothetical protein
MNKRIKYASIGLFFFSLLLLGLARYRDYGISSDEPAQWLTGAVTLKYVDEMFHVPASMVDWKRSFPPLATYPDRDYGVAFEAPAFALELLFRLKDFREVFMFRHLLTFLVSFGGVCAIYRLANRRFSSWQIGLLSASFFVLTPRFFAESFYNCKDIVFMALFAIAMDTTITFVLNPNTKTALLHALATAVAIDVRIMALALVAVSSMFLGTRLIRRDLELAKTCLLLALYIILTSIFVVIMWPYLWSRPLGHFVQAFKNMAHFRWQGDVRYMGEFIPASALPWHYTFTWISITTPLLYLALFAIGVYVICRQMLAHGIKLWEDDKQLQDVIFLVLFFGPILATILFHSVLYDGWRQQYFVYPAFLLLATRGWMALWSTERTGHGYKISLIIVTAISAVFTATWMWRAHPLENVYFNMLAGKNVKARYEMDYWGLGNRRALEYILAHDNSPVVDVWADSATPLGVSVIMLKPNDGRRVRLADDKRTASYVLTNYRGVKDTDSAKYEREYDLFYEIRMNDEVVLSVFKWRGATSASGKP